MAGSLWLLGRLPMPIGRALVWPLGPLMYYLMGSRRRIAERNLEACFPEKPAAERRAILRQSFHSMARMLIETAWCWAGDAQDLQAVIDVDNEAVFEQMKASGQGALVVTAHVTCLEIGALALGTRVPVKGVYRPLKNEVMEWYQNRGRDNYGQGMFSKRDVRGSVRHLRAGGILWYAPDQDFGAAQSIFAPFFGIQTATLLATHRLPVMTGCRVYISMPRYDRTSRRYLLSMSPALEQFPSDDPAADLARINALLEEQVRQAPEQYWWIHRRFKTRPPGEPPFYGTQTRAPNIASATPMDRD